MFKFLRNPIKGILGSIRGIIDVTGGLREPLGSAIGSIGRALSNLGVAIEAAAVRSRLERESAVQGEARAATLRGGVGVLTDAEIPEATTKLRRRYSYRGLVEYIDKATGRHETRYLTVSNDSLLSQVELHDTLETLATGDYGVDRESIIRVEVQDVRKAGAAGTL